MVPHHPEDLCLQLVQQFEPLSKCSLHTALLHLLHLVENSFKKSGNTLEIGLRGLPQTPHVFINGSLLTIADIIKTLQKPFR